MGYYVEDEAEKVLRLAKLKAYGQCPSHNGHWNWENIWATGAIALAVGLFSLGYQSNYYQDHPKIQYETQTVEHQQPVKGISYQCTNTKGAPETGVAMTINIPESAMKTLKTCSFQIQY